MVSATSHFETDVNRQNLSIRNQDGESLDYGNLSPAQQDVIRGIVPQQGPLGQAFGATLSFATQYEVGAILSAKESDMRIIINEDGSMRAEKSTKFELRGLNSEGAPLNTVLSFNEKNSLEIDIDGNIVNLSRSRENFSQHPGAEDNKLQNFMQNIDKGALVEVPLDPPCPICEPISAAKF